MQPNSLNIKKQELRALNAEIMERELYKKEQERAINELLESGNTQLMALNHDILMATQQLRTIKNDIRNSKTDKILLEEDLQLIRVQIGRFTEPDITFGIISS